MPFGLQTTATLGGPQPLGEFLARYPFQGIQRGLTSAATLREVSQWCLPVVWGGEIMSAGGRAAAVSRMRIALCKALGESELLTLSRLPRRFRLLLALALALEVKRSTLLPVRTATQPFRPGIPGRPARWAPSGLRAHPLKLLPSGHPGRGQRCGSLAGEP